VATPAVAALWVAVESTHGFFGFAWLALGNAAIGMSLPMRLAPYTALRRFIAFVDDVGGAGAAAVGTAAAGAGMDGGAPRPVPSPGVAGHQHGRESALLVQPNLSETEEWTAESVDRATRAMAKTRRTPRPSTVPSALHRGVAGSAGAVPLR